MDNEIQLISDGDGLAVIGEEANAKIVWNRTKSLDVVASANDLAAGLDDFHGLLTIEAGLRSWEARELGRAADTNA